MKNFLLKCILFVTLFSLFICEVNAQNISYKNIKTGAKISVTQDGTWVNKCLKGNACYEKKISSDEKLSSEFYSANDELAFSTETQYEFIKNGKLIGYSNSDLKFYEFVVGNDGNIQKEELLPDEVQQLFPNYKIIKISEFVVSTNSLKIHKKGGTLKLIILNDTDKKLEDYSFTTHNSKIETYPLSGLVDIHKKGLVHFSHYEDNNSETPWYILLIRQN